MMSLLAYIPSTVALGERVLLLGPDAAGALDVSSGVPAAKLRPRRGAELETPAFGYSNQPAHLGPGGREQRAVPVRTQPLGYGSHAFALAVFDGGTAEPAASVGPTIRVFVDTDPPPAVAVAAAPLSGDRLRFTFTPQESA